MKVDLKDSTVIAAVRQVVRDAVLDALAVLSPVCCAGCGAADRSLCGACRAQLQPFPAPRTLADGLTVFTALRYEGVVRHSILAFKESGRTDVAKALAPAFAAAIAEAREAAGAVVAGAALAEVLFVPVPTSRAARRRRGFDPVALLSRRAGSHPDRILVNIRRTRSQKTLGFTDRATNLRESMIARQDLSGKRVILLDDVLTTGASLTEAARAVRAAGGEVVCGAAVAFTPRIFASPTPAETAHSDIASQGG